MGKSLYIRLQFDKDQNPTYKLQERYHDLSGVDYVTLVKITRKQAAALMCFAPWIGGNVDYKDLYTPDLQMDRIRIERAPNREIKTPSFIVILGNAEPLLCGSALADILNAEAKIPYQDEKALKHSAELDRLRDEGHQLRCQQVEIQNAIHLNEDRIAYMTRLAAEAPATAEQPPVEDEVSPSL